MGGDILTGKYPDILIGQSRILVEIVVSGLLRSERSLRKVSFSY